MYRFVKRLRRMALDFMVGLVWQPVMRLVKV